MSELNNGPNPQAEGQAATDPPAGVTTATAPNAEEGQAKTQGSAGDGQAHGTQAEDTFFDPNTLPPELKATYKKMQAAYTKKTMELASHRPKIEAYDQFMRDPVTNLQMLARQYGMNLTKADAKAAIEGQQQAPARSGFDANWQPQSWNEVVDKFREILLPEFQQQMAPFTAQVQKVQAANIEAELNKIDPEWRLYEDEMRQNLSELPGLVNNIAKLYRISVPEEVLTSRAVQAALKKFEEKGKAASMGTKTETSKAAPAPKGKMTFAESVEYAKNQLANRR